MKEDGFHQRLTEQWLNATRASKQPPTSDVTEVTSLGYDQILLPFAVLLAASVCVSPALLLCELGYKKLLAAIKTR